MKKLWIEFGFAILLFSVVCPLSAQGDDVEMRAMRDELQRSIKQLHLESAEGPYYVAYKIVDTNRKEAEASFGSLTSSIETRNRVLSVEVRVGSYEFDNTNAPVSASNSIAQLLSGFLSANVTLPLDDNYEELRRKIWLATDAAYKRAVEQLAAKKAAEQNKTHEQGLADFLKEPAREESEILPPVDEKLADAERLVRTASEVFRKQNSVETSGTSFAVVNTTERFVNSEGTTYRRQVSQLSFRATASVQSHGGETLSDSYSAYARSLADFPSETALLQGVREMSARLNQRLHGKGSERYNGPVLFEGQASAEFFADHLARLFSAHPHPVSTGNSGVNAILNGSTADLRNKLNGRVLPDFMSVSDDAQLTHADDHLLLGGYKFDEEGTPAQHTVLIQNGIVKGLLTSRTPVKDLPGSTGNMRVHGVLPSNLLVESQKTLSADELKAKLLDLVKMRGLEFGIVVRELAGDNATEAVRLFADGHEEPLRDAHLADLNAGLFKEIVAVSKERAVLTQQMTPAGLASLAVGSPGDLVSYVVPGMLLEDMTVERVSSSSPKPAAVPSPFVAK